VHADSELPLDDICAALLEGKQLKPNTSTVVVAVGSSQLLHALDTKTASLIDHIISFQDTTGPIGTAPLPNCSKPHPCSDIIPPASLRKLRRTFMQSVQISPPAPKASAPPCHSISTTTHAHLNLKPTQISFCFIRTRATQYETKISFVFVSFATAAARHSRFRRTCAT
jgi:hypothetical protein